MSIRTVTRAFFAFGQRFDPSTVYTNLTTNQEAELVEGGLATYYPAATADALRDVSPGDTNYFAAAQYGAKGDGVTDDSGAIQWAINAANSAGGGTVLLDAKTYYIGSPLVPADGVTVRGVLPNVAFTSGQAPDLSFYPTSGTVLRGVTTAQDSGDIVSNVCFQFHHTGSPAADTIARNFWIENLSFSHFKHFIEAGSKDWSSFFGGGLRNVWGAYTTDVAIKVYNFQHWRIDVLKCWMVTGLIYACNYNNIYSGGNSVWSDCYGYMANGSTTDGKTWTKPAFGIMLEAKTSQGVMRQLNAMSIYRPQINAFGGSMTTIPDSAHIKLIGDNTSKVSQCTIPDADIEGPMMWGVLMDKCGSCDIGLAAIASASDARAFFKIRNSTNYNFIKAQNASVTYESDSNPIYGFGLFKGPTSAAANLLAVSARVSVGGTGYTLGDALTVVGGTGTAATFTVTGVSDGVVTDVALATQGNYTATPSNPASTSGGTGSGCALTVNYYGQANTYSPRGIYFRNDINQMQMNGFGHTNYDWKFDTTNNQNALDARIKGAPRDVGSATFNVIGNTTTGIIRLSSASAQTGTLGAAATEAGMEYEFTLGSSAGGTKTITDGGSFTDTLVTGVDTYLRVKSDGLKWFTVVKA